MGDTILFSTTPVSGSVEGAYQAHAAPNRLKNAAAIAADLAEAKRTSVPDETRELAYLRDYVMRELGKGNALAFGGFTLTPAILGTFASADAAFDPSRHELAVVGRTFGALRKAAEGLDAVNVNAPLKAVLYGVMDAVTKSEDLVTYGICYLQGRGLAVDAGRTDEGVWLLSGGRTWRAEVRESDSQTVNCVFAELPPGGPATVRLVTRGGGPAAFAPVTLERAVTVRHVRPVGTKLDSVTLTYSDGTVKVLTPEEAEKLR